jgi:hypothetical protein
LVLTPQLVQLSDEGIGKLADERMKDWSKDQEEYTEKQFKEVEEKRKSVPKTPIIEMGLSERLAVYKEVEHAESPSQAMVDLIERERLEYAERRRREELQNQAIREKAEAERREREAKAEIERKAALKIQDEKAAREKAEIERRNQEAKEKALIQKNEENEAAEKIRQKYQACLQQFRDWLQEIEEKRETIKSKMIDKSGRTSLIPYADHLRNLEIAKLNREEKQIKENEASQIFYMEQNMEEARAIVRKKWACSQN